MYTGEVMKNDNVAKYKDEFVAIGLRIGYIRRQKGMTQEQLAEKAGLSLGFLILFHIEQGAHQRTSPGSPAPCRDISVSSPVGDGKSEFVRQSPYHPLQSLVVLRKSVAEMLRKVKRILNNFI